MTLRFLLSLALAFTAVSSGAQDSGTRLPAWLAGAWVMESGAVWADETWSAPRGGMMIGSMRSGFGADLSEWGQSRIVRKADGRLSFVAQPGGGRPVEYPLVTMSEAAIEFANPSHEYPQRIRYERVGQLLIAELSRMDGSEAIRWQYRLMAE